MYRAIEREVPKGQLLFLTGRVGQVTGYGIRMYSRQPVAWSRQEGRILGYSNPAALVEDTGGGQALERVSSLTGEASRRH